MTDGTLGLNFPVQDQAMREALVRGNICPQCGGALNSDSICRDTRCGHNAQQDAVRANTANK